VGCGPQVRVLPLDCISGGAGAGELRSLQPTRENHMKEYIKLNEDGTVDDVVLGATSIHIEDLGDRIWVAVYRADGDRFTFEMTPALVTPGEYDIFAHAQCDMVEGSVGSLKDDQDTGA
jgi:hypothetical protein